MKKTVQAYIGLSKPKRWKLQSGSFRTGHNRTVSVMPAEETAHHSLKTVLNSCLIPEITLVIVARGKGVSKSS